MCSYIEYLVSIMFSPTQTATLLHMYYSLTVELCIVEIDIYHTTTLHKISDYIPGNFSD